MDYAKLTAIVTALSFLAIGVADAQSKQKRQRARDSAPASMTQDGVRAPTSRNISGSCHTDDGYGRWWPCGAGPK